MHETRTITYQCVVQSPAMMCKLHCWVAQALKKKKKKFKKKKKKKRLQSTSMYSNKWKLQILSEKAAPIKCQDAYLILYFKSVTPSFTYASGQCWTPFGLRANIKVQLLAFPGTFILPLSRKKAIFYLFYSQKAASHLVSV